MSTLADEMKSRLALYVTQQASLDQFEDWFGRALFEARKAKDVEAESFGNAIEWLFFDLDRGADVEEVRRAMKLLSGGNRVVFSQLVVVPNVDDYSSTNASGTSSSFQAAAGSGSFGPSQILRETEHELSTAP
jgi:hypothetical protein